MSEDVPVFPEYGDGGDEMGSRRSRHAFRFSVASVVLLTGMLWFGETYLQHRQTERLYFRSLTLHREAARNFLKQAVKLDNAKTPKYLQALAEREAGEESLRCYREAFALDPDNASLAIRFGCRFLEMGFAEEARDCFSKAIETAPENSLPMYLAASVSPWVRPEEGDLRPSLALIAKANSSGRRVVLPRPLWFSGLPQRGYWYAELRRETVRDCCAPLVHFGEFAGRQADEHIQRGDVQYWDSWLEKLEVMGRHLADEAVPKERPESLSFSGAALQALDGIRIQHMAVALRQRVREVEAVAPSDDLIARRMQLENAEAELSEFEGIWSERVLQERKKYEMPLRLVAEGLVLLTALYVATYVLVKGFRIGKAPRSLPHSRFAVCFVSGGAGLLLFLLAATIPFQRITGPHPAWARSIAWAWFFTLAALLVYGGLYPVLRLPFVGKVCGKRDHSADSDRIRATARRRRRAAVMALLHRYVGITLGLFLVAVCCWVLLHRMVVGAYPMQISLLASGLEEEETELVARVLSGLHL